MSGFDATGLAHENLQTLYQELFGEMIRGLTELGGEVMLYAEEPQAS